MFRLKRYFSAIGNLLNSRQRKSFFDVVKEERSLTIKVTSVVLLFDQGLSGFLGFGAPALKCFELFAI